MADWFAALKEQADLISRLAAEVPAILNDPQLTAERAKRVYERVEAERSVSMPYWRRWIEIAPSQMDS